MINSIVFLRFDRHLVLHLDLLDLAEHGRLIFAGFSVHESDHLVPCESSFATSHAFAAGHVCAVCAWGVFGVVVAGLCGAIAD